MTSQIHKIINGHQNGDVVDSVRCSSEIAYDYAPQVHYCDFLVWYDLWSIFLNFVQSNSILFFDYFCEADATLSTIGSSSTGGLLLFIFDRLASIIHGLYQGFTIN